MPNIFVRVRLLALVAAIPVVFALQSRAYGQDPALEVFYTKLEPKEQFKYKWKGKEAVCSAGVFRWEVPQTEFGTNGLDRNFTGYCAEIRVPITAEKLYRFRVNSLYEVPNYEGLTKKEGAELAAQKRVTYIKELFGRYYRDPVLKSVNSDEAVALQIALWEVIQETEPAEGAVKFDLYGGDFQANYKPAEAPAYVKLAQQYLDSLAGNDGAFYENPDLRGRELIRLQGIENADKIVAQSQFALRFVGGGASGAGGLSAALTNGTGLGAIGGFGPVGGVGTAGGAGSGGFVQTNPNGNGFTTTPPTTTPPTTTPPTQPPVTTPPTGGPPDQPPDTPDPVPAPAGLLLGAIALGTIGTWRLGVRVLAAK